MITLELTEEQARVVSIACEFYARIRMGQFHVIVPHTLDFKLPCDDYCERREKADNLFIGSQEGVISRIT